MIMEAIPGEPMLALMLRRLMSIFWAPAAMARAQAQLHKLPTRGFPHFDKPFLHRRLAELRQAIANYDLSGLMPGLGWLRRYRPNLADAPCVVHLDFHPTNLIFHRWCFRGVVDWCESDLGDRHADLAVSLLLIDSTPLDNLTLRQGLVSRLGRYLLREFYLRTYRRILPIHGQRLRYYLAWAALARLARWGMWLRDSPLITGSKPSAVIHVTDEAIGFLEDYFETITGVAIHLRASQHRRAVRSTDLVLTRHISH
jgi:aminoglycoside phosphotransferase (APT) family kinase protein